MNEIVAVRQILDVPVIASGSRAFLIYHASPMAKACTGSHNHLLDCIILRLMLRNLPNVYSTELPCNGLAVIKGGCCFPKAAHP